MQISHAVRKRPTDGHPPNAASAGSLRIVLAKAGLDGHDRGVKVVARILRDAGHEVVYLGLRQTPEEIVGSALQEDADLIGISILSGSHLTQFSRIHELLMAYNATDIAVFGGGIIPDGDVPVLHGMGVAKVFTPGATSNEITDWIAEFRPPRRSD